MPIPSSTGEQVYQKPPCSREQFMNGPMTADQALEYHASLNTEDVLMPQDATSSNRTNRRCHESKFFESSAKNDLGLVHSGSALHRPRASGRQGNLPQYAVPPLSIPRGRLPEQSNRRTTLRRCVLQFNRWYSLA